MKNFLVFILVVTAAASKAQTVDSIYLNLYTDSLKKGTYNYINADGLLSNGRYIPLDTTRIILTSSAGRFEGNSLWIDPQFSEKKIMVTVTLRQNKALSKTAEIWIKQLPDGPLKTAEQLMKEMKQQAKRKG